MTNKPNNNHLTRTDRKHAKAGFGEWWREAVMIHNVVEVNVSEGWAKVRKKDGSKEIIHGDFEIMIYDN